MLGETRKPFSPVGPESQEGESTRATLNKWGCKILVINWLMAVGLLHWTFGISGATPFQVTGQITYEQWLVPNVSSTAVFQFTTRVAGERYSVRVVPSRPHVFDYQDIAFDGTNLYLLTSFESVLDQAESKRPRNVDPRTINKASAFIYKGPILHNIGAHIVGPIWLAFGSSEYLRHAEDHTLEGVLAFDASGPVTPDSVRLQKADWECQNTLPYLPARVVFHDSGILPIGNSHPEPYNRGFTNAVYHVSRFSVHEGVVFPQEAILQVYYPKANGKSNTDLKLAVTYRIIVDDVKFGEVPAITPPEIPGTATFVDERLGCDVVRGIVRRSGTGAGVFPQRTPPTPL